MSKKVTTNAHAREADIKPRIVYSDELLAEILDRVAKGEALSNVCDTDRMPTRKTFFLWVKDNQEIQAQYELAIQMRADILAEDMLKIADDGLNDTYTDENGNIRTNAEVVARSKLRIDARKWLASKMAPKKYGDKISQEISGADGSPLTVQIIKYGDNPTSE